MAKANTLTERQQRFCAEFVSGEFAGNMRRSYQKVYNSTNLVAVDTRLQKIMKMPKIQNEIERLKEGAGLTDEFIFKRIREGLDAKFIASYRGRATQTDLPDHNVRHKFLDTAAKLRDMFPSQKVESRSINIDVQIEKLPPAELAKLLTEMAKQINAGPKGKTRLLNAGEV